MPDSPEQPKESEDSEATEGVATETLESTEELNEETGTDAAQEASESTTVPEFVEATERTVRRLDTSTTRLHGVSVPVWAELGRVEMLIGDLLQLGEGSVVRLDRSVGDPVELISQGVKLARGEVIVVDECFAIRIREILSEK